MKTTRESTRAPGSTIKARQEKMEQLLDPAVFRHVLVEDKIPGVPVNFRNVDWYRRQGYEVVSADSSVTGHEGLTLMAITHDEFAKRESERERRDNRGHVAEDDREGYEQGLRQGVVVREAQGFRLSELGSQLPSRSEIEQREAQAEFNAMSLNSVPAIRRAAESVARDAE
jgi:hypothetical protein